MTANSRNTGLETIFTKCIGHSETEAIEIEKAVRREKFLRNSPPLKTDVDEALDRLKDFKIKIIRIPEFNKLSELELWTKKKIKEKLFSL